MRRPGEVPVVRQHETDSATRRIKPESRTLTREISSESPESLAFEIIRNRIAAGKSRLLIGVRRQEDEFAFLKSQVRALVPSFPATRIDMGRLQEDTGTTPWQLAVTASGDSKLLGQAARNSDELIVITDERNQSAVSSWRSQLPSSESCRVRVLKRQCNTGSHALVVLGNCDNTGELSRVGRERVEAARDLTLGVGADLVFSAEEQSPTL